MRKIVILLLVFCFFLAKSFGQCTSTINSNTNMAGSNGTSPFAGSPYFMHAYLSNSCAGYDGPSINNWYEATNTPDALAGNYVSGYIYRNVPVPKEFYESFYTTADLIPFQPNTTYFYSFEVAMKNLHGTSQSILEVVNRDNTNGFNGNCAFFSGIEPQLSANGPVLFTEVIPSTSVPSVAPVFIKICGNFTTGATLPASNIIWFRFTFASPSSVEEQQNYHYIKNFKIFPCESPNVAEFITCCPSVKLGNDTSICSNLATDFPVIVKNDVFDSYNWHDASTGNSFLLTQLNRTSNDFYWVEGNRANCPPSRDSIKANFISCCPDQLSLGKDSIVCEHKQITLQPNGDAFDSYTWQNATTGNSLVLTKSDKTPNNIYWVEGQTPGCPLVRDSIEISFIDCCAQKLLYLGKDSVYCENEIIALQANAGFQNYAWQNGSTNSFYEITTYTRAKDNIYWVEATSDCGIKRDSIKIEFAKKEDIYIPNLITPNSDGKNDLFEISSLQNTTHKVSIYNRWGTLIYQNPNYDNSWDGDNSPNAVYYFLIEDTVCRYRYKGWLQLLR